LFRLISYDFIIGSIFGATYFVSIFLDPKENRNIIDICIYASTTLICCIVVAASFIVICTILFIQKATVSQQYLVSTREAVPDRKKIIGVCVAQIVIYAVQGLLQLVNYISIMNNNELYCNSKFFYVLANTRSIIQNLCRSIGALIIMLFLNAYQKALIRIKNKLIELLKKFLLLFKKLI
jgi:hypothetical protein